MRYTTDMTSPSSRGRARPVSRVSRPPRLSSFPPSTLRLLVCFPPPPSRPHLWFSLAHAHTHAHDPLFPRCHPRSQQRRCPAPLILTTTPRTCTSTARWSTSTSSEWSLAEFGLGFGFGLVARVGRGLTMADGGACAACRETTTSSYARSVPRASSSSRTRPAHCPSAPPTSSVRLRGSLLHERLLY